MTNCPQLTVRKPQVAPQRSLRILTIAALDRNPQGGAAGTIISCNEALRDLGHVVDEVWNNSLPQRRIRHHNLYSLLEKPKAFADVVSQLASNHYDAIVVQEPQGFKVPAVLRSGGHRAAVVTLSQGIEKRIFPILAQWRHKLKASHQESPRSILSPLMNRLLNRHWSKVCQLCDGFLIVNEDDRTFLLEQQQVASSKVHLWKSGLDPAFRENRLPLTEERLHRIIYVGQTAFYKFPRLIIDAVSSILEAHDTATFTWITHSDHHHELLNRFPDTIRDRVKFMPWMDLGSLIRQLDRHGIMLFPTIVEGFGRAALEAMSRGICVVSSRSSGMQDYIQDGKNGFLRDVGDTHAFVNTAQRLLEDFSLSEQISNAAAVTAAEFTWENVAAELATFLIGLDASGDGTLESK
jgi:glycosyltransferase involved in cell wall biosynthesis